MSKTIEPVRAIPPMYYAEGGPKFHSALLPAIVHEESTPTKLPAVMNFEKLHAIVRPARVRSNIYLGSGMFVGATGIMGSTIGGALLNAQLLGSVGIAVSGACGLLLAARAHHKQKNTGYNHAPWTTWAARVKLTRWLAEQWDLTVTNYVSTDKQIHEFVQEGAATSIKFNTKNRRLYQVHRFAPGGDLMVTDYRFEPVRVSIKLAAQRRGVPYAREYEDRQRAYPLIKTVKPETDLAKKMRETNPAAVFDETVKQQLINMAPTFDELVKIEADLSETQQHRFNRSVSIILNALQLGHKLRHLTGVAREEAFVPLNHSIIAAVADMLAVHTDHQRDLIREARVLGRYTREVYGEDALRLP